ncbi:hypothetical protein GUJ93_ZPchr0002g25992 [Zizania palustris]|uniref:Uncharacterized protein n=1 Tax=Zizania palustris TaxID=103762 RepID=A0A8J5VI60_ZIZPA|nr:hypothetical protein GUJ93_ZPchr0002g25992 [Zizania palustris]
MWKSSTLNWTFAPLLEIVIATVDLSVLFTKLAKAADFKKKVKAAEATTVVAQKKDDEAIELHRWMKDQFDDLELRLGNTQVQRNHYQAKAEALLKMIDGEPANAEWSTEHFMEQLQGSAASP